ncbi:hypothetical protein NC651_028198 [Populus alba x Populus x berolinensis]|nr:hypothetical protein NC651_028198 [Populus alba x Populus x berolinensis]
MIYNQNNAVMTLKSNRKTVKALCHPKRYNLPSSKPKQRGGTSSKLGLHNKIARNPLILFKILLQSFHMTSPLVNYLIQR